MKYYNSSFLAFWIVVFIAVVLVASVVEGQEIESDECSQRSDPGICRASIPRFYYDSSSGRCDQFIYGGCGGNRNNFRSISECASFRSYCLRRRGF